MHTTTLWGKPTLSVATIRIAWSTQRAKWKPTVFKAFYYSRRASRFVNKHKRVNIRKSAGKEFRKNRTVGEDEWSWLGLRQFVLICDFWSKIVRPSTQKERHFLGYNTGTFGGNISGFGEMLLNLDLSLILIVIYPFSGPVKGRNWKQEASGSIEFFEVIIFFLILRHITQY